MQRSRELEKPKVRQLLSMTRVIRRANINIPTLNLKGKRIIIYWLALESGEDAPRKDQLRAAKPKTGTRRRAAVIQSQL